MPRVKRMQVAITVLVQISKDKPTAININAPGMGEINEIAPRKINMYAMIIRTSLICSYQSEFNYCLSVDSSFVDALACLLKNTFLVNLTNSGSKLNLMYKM